MLIVFNRDNVRGSRRGLTLVEMLVAVAVTLILLFAILKLAQLIGSSSETGRSMLELSGEIRSAANRMQIDLDRTTCKTLAWVNSSAAQGYFEYIEGPLRDGGAGADSLAGDTDDAWAATLYSPDQPFTGRGINGTITSEYAEVVWWVTAEADGTMRLRRRVFLVMPTVNLTGYNPQQLLTDYDISFSVRTSGMSSAVVANSMADLSRREYRTIHQPMAGGTSPQNTNSYAMGNMALQGNLQGEDVVLGRCLAMDIKAYDPFAPIGAGPLSALVPGDPGYNAATASASNFGRGAYVDLNFAGSSGSWFSGPPNPKASPNTAIPVPFYDFWSAHYENDGVDQDGVNGPDQGVDGLDNDGNNGVDDANERETSPPYPYPLRGVKVILRAYEPSSRQVRQASVVGDFVPN